MAPPDSISRGQKFASELLSSTQRTFPIVRRRRRERRMRALARKAHRPTGAAEQFESEHFERNVRFPTRPMFGDRHSRPAEHQLKKPTQTPCASANSGRSRRMIHLHERVRAPTIWPIIEIIINIIITISIIIFPLWLAVVRDHRWLSGMHIIGARLKPC